MELTLDEALQKAVEAHKAGQVQKADRLYTAILKAQPKHPDANHNMGVLAVSVGKVQEAPPFFRTALEANPSIGQYWLSYINALISLDRIADAISVLNQAKGKGAKGEAFDQLEQRLNSPNEVSIDPPQDQQQRLINLYRQGQFQQALDYTKQLLSKLPNSLTLYNIQGAANAELGQFDAAVDSYKQALKINPDYADACYNMGNALRSKGDLEAAIKSYKQALEIKPDCVEAYYNMGNALKDKGDLDAAIDSYKQALKIKPNSAEIYYNIGTVLQNKDDLEAAIDSYKQALQIKPDYADAHNNMGTILMEKGDLEAAIDSYKQALQIKPDYAEAYNNMGIVLMEKGNLEVAIGSYKNAIKIKPDYAEAYLNMGTALKNKGDLDAAIDNYKKALKIKPDFADAYYNMGIALRDRGELEAALVSYQQAIKIKPDSAVAYCNMSVILKDKGDIEAAMDSCKQALKIKPELAEAWNNLIVPLLVMKLQTPDIEELLSTIIPKAGSKYAQIAKSVLSFSLYQGGVNAESALNEVCSHLSKADNIIIRNPEVTKKEFLPQIIGPIKTVALVHFGRSGTGLLHSLIDGHPEVSGMPSIYFSEFFNHSTWDKIISGGWSNMADRFIATYEVLFDASVQNPVESIGSKFIVNLGQKEGMANVGDQRDEVLKVDKALFRAELQRLMDLRDHLDAYVFFTLVHKAYDKVLNDFNHKHLMFYHIHNPDNYAKLNFVQAAPNANWIMMVREPLQACEAWIRGQFQNNEYTFIPAKIISMLFEIDNVIYHKQRSVGVRLEDLKEFPEKTIPALCDWMGIEQSESLYEMTAQGKKWWGDPVSPDYNKDGMEPFGKTSIRRKVGSVFDENDQFILHTLFYPFSVQFGYVEENLEQFKANLKTIRPMLDEMFGFEKIMSEHTQVDAEQFMKSGSYLYLRSGLIERWNLLAKLHTYPNMIKPLDIS
jgi:tetratricopeptide (TPR) repeat protein